MLALRLNIPVFALYDRIEYKRYGRDQRGEREKGGSGNQLLAAQSNIQVYALYDRIEYKSNGRDGGG